MRFKRAHGNLGGVAVDYVFGRFKFCAQIFERIVDAHRIDQLARVHAIVRVEQNLELAEGLHQLRSIHFGQQGRARLSVSMLA